jgi:hypothetical protein
MAVSDQEETPADEFDWGLAKPPVQKLWADIPTAGGTKTLTPNQRKEPFQIVVMEGTMNLAAPASLTNWPEGGTYTLLVTQDGTGGRVLTVDSFYTGAAADWWDIAGDAGAGTLLTFVRAAGKGILIAKERGFSI